ncbi:MAG TPA: ABC transporter permease [candidate division Zixibacteria bacterium]|nr:ABC transporter permease [candidate division Zixibacteria bacterium]
MRKILWLVRREYLTTIRTKGFLIGLLIAPLLFGGSGIVFMLMKDRVDTTDKHVAIIDRSGILADEIIKAAAARNSEVVFDEQGKKVRPAYKFESIPPNEADPYAQRLELSDMVRDGRLHAFVEIGPEVLYPDGDEERSSIRYYGKNAALDNIRSWVVYPINNHLRKLRLMESGVDESQVSNVLRWLDVEGLGLVSVDEATGEIQAARRSSEIELLMVPIAVLVLMYMMLMMTALPLLNAVMEEKSQRIAEVLLGSMKPFEFMAGKVLGAIALSLTMAAVYVGGGLATVRYLGLGDYIPYHVLPWFFVYLILAILMYGSLFAAFGSACNNAKDAQSLTFPAILPLIISWFLFMPVLQEPTAGFSTWLSLFPLCTPMLMLLRITSPIGIPAWQPWVGLIGVILFTVFTIWAGGRIFRVAILIQGTPPKLSRIIRWALRG